MIAELVQKYQLRAEPQPPSLITMHTPAGLDVDEEEHYLRERILQLWSQQGEDISCIDGILEIMRTLKSEGDVNVKFEHEDGLRIAVELAPFMDSASATRPDLILYHILIWKTAGDSMWTMERRPNEQNVVPYLPALLEASLHEMTAEICSTGSHLLPQQQDITDEVRKSLADTEWQEEDWQEISILEFVNATLPSKIAQAKGPTNQPVIPIVVAKDRNLSWREARDSDRVSGDTVFEAPNNNSYVRTADIRTLYENRPELMKRMCLGQLACEYRVLTPRQHGYEKAKNSINEDTGVGPNSDVLVAGTSDVFAPKTMMLKNEKILIRRQEVMAAPNLLYSGCTSKHGNQLMWSHWEKLEDVTGEQIEEETESQKSVREQIFPLSVFPILEDESEEDDR